VIAFSVLNTTIAYVRNNLSIFIVVPKT